MSARQLGAIRHPPLFFTERPGPERVSAESQPVSSAVTNDKPVKTQLQRLVTTRHDAERLHVALGRVRCADGCRRRARDHIQLRRRSKHGKRGAFGAPVKRRELHVTEERTLVARIITHGPICRGGNLSGSRLPQGNIRGAEIGRHLNLRNRQRRPVLVEAVRLAVFRQHVFHLQPGDESRSRSAFSYSYRFRRLQTARPEVCSSA